MAGTRKEKMAETRSRLLQAARKAFGTVGYTDASMDDFTAAVGLTRGALYHHFGDKQGLLRAVVEQIDTEMAERLSQISRRAPTRWQGLVDEWTAYIEMALEPEIQRIMFRDGPAVLGDVSQWASTDNCVTTLKKSLDDLKADGLLIELDTEAAARLINGAASHAATWIAASADPQATSMRAVSSFRQLLNRLREGDIQPTRTK
ncbi:TetR/AcrR family transcriptional regulator [Ollibium composti]|uniref:TetR/AcrR family transcriptional regulator n=1 Tax=Ollibium composti TaxID=2675109 RepID=A0ABY2Q2J9_9HYPH|nr:TetR/AcrR family transcriptional regulator [Mesorhizobium composti]THF55080.1 TetR/AcrR family transcriptional regulator [Mesorhizobium composti]